MQSLICSFGIVNKLNPFPWKCQQELRFDDDDMLVGYLLPLDSRVLWIGVCLISPRRASSIIASRDILEDYRRRQEKERQLAGEKSLLRLFSGVTGCTKKIVVVLFALPVDNCYSSFISASYLSQNIRICRQQQSRKMECS